MTQFELDVLLATTQELYQIRRALRARFVTHYVCIVQEEYEVRICGSVSLWVRGDTVLGRVDD